MRETCPARIGCMNNWLAIAPYFVLCSSSIVHIRRCSFLFALSDSSPSTHLDIFDSTGYLVVDLLVVELIVVDAIIVEHKVPNGVVGSGSG